MAGRAGTLGLLLIITFLACASDATAAGDFAVAGPASSSAPRQVGPVLTMRFDPETLVWPSGNETTKVPLEITVTCPHSAVYPFQYVLELSPLPFGVGKIEVDPIRVYPFAGQQPCIDDFQGQAQVELRLHEAPPPGARVPFGVTGNLTGQFTDPDAYASAHANATFAYLAAVYRLISPEGGGISSEDFSQVVFGGYVNADTTVNVRIESEAGLTAQPPNFTVRFAAHARSTPAQSVRFKAEASCDGPSPVVMHYEWGPSGAAPTMAERLAVLYDCQGFIPRSGTREGATPAPDVLAFAAAVVVAALLRRRVH